MRRIKPLILATLLGLSCHLNSSDIEGVRLYRSPDGTRIVLDLDEPVDHKMFTLENPQRVVVDIKDVTLNTSFDMLDLDVTPIRQIRTGARG